MSGKRSIFEDVSGETKVAPTPGAVSARDGRGAIRVWLWILLALVITMVIVGGLTRLTDSGLSITEWNLIVGALPPLSEADWNAAFADYQTTDEYRLQNSWMTLADFKPIFWWEWGHRFLGRFLGIVWFIPLVYFAVRGMIPRGWGGKLILIGALGGLQGAVGWWMVYSGLSVRVDVAPYRLATHLGIAFTIFALIYWYILKIGKEGHWLLAARRRRAPGMFGWSAMMTTLIFLQILLGALVAGTDAGRYHTDWPLMDGVFFPETALEMVPLWSNFFENTAMVQFMHRMLAYVLVVVAVLFALKGRKSGHGRISYWATALTLGVLFQGVWGIATLLHAAPVHLAIFHQLFALGLLGLSMRAKFEMAYPSEQKIRA
ncbi:MAG: COX15/CtaA family protein [Pikeienuella sp.]